MIAVTDVFDCLTSDRPYRRALSAEAALDELRSQGGRQFDHQVVDAFERVWNQGRIRLSGSERIEGEL